MIILLVLLGVVILALWLHCLAWIRAERKRDLPQGPYGLTQAEEQVWKDLVNRYHKS